MKKTKSASGLKGIFFGKGGLRMRPLLFVLLFAAIGAFFLIRSFAATGQIYLVSSAANVQVNQDVNVTVRINPGTPIDIVEDVIVTYDPAMLEYRSISTEGSPFEADLGQIINPGSIEVNRATFNASIGTDSLIAVITFKALAGSGNTSLQVTGNAAGSGGYTNPLGGNLALTFSSPPVVTNGAINGVVTSSNGSPLADTTVSYSVNGSKRSIKTGTNGSYTISNLPAGTYSVKFSVKRHQAQTLTIAVAAGTVTTQNVTLQQR